MVIDFLTMVLRRLGVAPTTSTLTVLTVAIIAVEWLLVYMFLVHVFWGAVKRMNAKKRRFCLVALIDSNAFERLVLIVLCLTARLQMWLWIPEETVFVWFLEELDDLMTVILGMIFSLSMIKFISTFLNATHLGKKLPIGGMTQALRLIVVVFFVILLASVLLERSPLYIFSGLGAMTAVAMLIFQDSIRGFVAGVQLSIYNLLAVGDTVEMPKYNADGAVIEIGLTTVKVQNWDKTIVSVPTSVLMSDSFKNWSGMSMSGGRRMKRSVFIDVASIHFLSDEEIERLEQIKLISGYLKSKKEELDQHNKNLDADLSNPINGRRLTNIGTFRAYLAAYLEAHPNVHDKLTLMVRQLEPTAEGLPIEIYAFTSTTAWTDYENIQSDIFDHIFAVLPEFGLRAYQSPAGSDIRSIGDKPT